LDAFGEEDYDMSRGKPLYLSKERYTALTNMVVSHGLDHSAHVLLQTTRDTVFII
jgi:E3 ubiquitin-protein ligase UBR3